jgi:hypothetical protein
MNNLITNKKTKILGYGIFIFLIIFLLGFYSNDILIYTGYAACEDDGDTSDTGDTGSTGGAYETTPDEDKYLCQRCDSSNNCMQYWSTSKCTTSCSGCQTYTCKICSNGSCSSKTFNTSCSDTCAVNSDCVGSSCYKCTDGQCRIYTVATGTCIDSCTSDSQCVGSSPTTRDDRESGWNCNTVQKTCVYLSNTNKTVYDTKAQCDAICVFCNKCWQQYFNLWGDYKCMKDYVICRGGTDGCQTDADCQPGATTPPTTQPEPTRYRCLSDGTCVVDPNGSHSNEQTCNDNCYSATPRCSVRATAVPNPIPEGQNQVSISATNLKNTSLSKCRVNSYSLPHTFAQTVSSRIYTVSCSGNSGYNSCSNSIRVTLGGATPDTTTPSPTTTTTTIPPCVINKFELPKRAWVDIETIASWSTNNCDTAEINCISEDCIEGVESLSGSVSIGINQNKNFTINAPGTYRYELEACGPDNCDTYEDVLGTGDPYIEIEALHLPWWQEIIPVLPDNLQGFLKGIFRI